MLVLLAALLLSLAVAAGAVLAMLNIRHRRVPLTAGMAHAGAAIAGLALLGAGMAFEDQPLAANAALLLFAIALLGGVFVLLFRLQGERPPMFMVGLHGLTAAVALAVLWAGVLASG